MSNRDLIIGGQAISTTKINKGLADPRGLGINLHGRQILVP